ncbi:PadR family transcriptional regulator [Mergibacter septicus]|uniref:PadR family transcriptional regulator n=1 Tax=Mergibacter septicus TaxID=221402 RepID=A0A8D4IWM3_9PAST|nr:helix-turn-helix transcriptional regulator [Mergibacter septicus]AWX15283.1 PadR family transcriptional regulator [Mergibacter septicus]QDJ14537.1 PadR family transcriptional regulator [Mergibacter septicus]UTU48027.1 PadR family transcriptional regulator [Mergibacter septicus]WMR96364.1 helix-turn-helix transcriptional regulator [Mergibacter septicus]
MALSHTILAILAHEEVSGYDIGKKFNQTYGLIWHASHQQVYRELSLLEKQGDIVFTLRAQVGKPDRKVYQITTQGEQNLRQWLLQTSLKSGINRDEFTSRLLAAIKFHPENALEVVQARIDSHRQNINNMSCLLEKLEKDPNKKHYDNLMMLILKKNLKQEKLNLEWAEQDFLPFLNDIMSL